MNDHAVKKLIIFVIFFTADYICFYTNNGVGFAGCIEKSGTIIRYC